MQIHFLGGATTVTGSQFLLETERARVLIDCGMFQGSPNESIRNRIPFAFDPADLDAVLLTHAHLDHCGLLPLLVKEGYAGPIHATAGTIELATLVLLDSGKLHEEFAKREARWERRHPDARRRGRPQGGGRLRGGPRDRGIRGRPARAGRRGRRLRPGVPTSTSRRHRARRHDRRTGRAGELAARSRRPSCGRSRRTWRSTSTSRSTPRTTPSGRSATSGPFDTARRSRSRPGSCATFLDAGHILGSAIIRLADPGARRRRGAGHRLLRRPRPARDADPARPDRR